MPNADKQSGGKPRRVGDGTPGPGRKKGIPNKATTEFRETVQRLLDDNRDNFSVWLGQVADTDPGKAIDLLAKLAEFAAPKLARTEHTGENGGPLDVSLAVKFIKPNG